MPDFRSVFGPVTRVYYQTDRHLRDLSHGMRMRLTASIIFFLVLFLPGAAAADIIYFKDGMRTVCHGKAWEEGEEVKCDYDGVILTYRRKDVEQIQKTIVLEEAAALPTPASRLPEAPISKPAGLQPASNAVRDGIAFYDPRRQYKYWTSSTARHRSYKEAINALAKEFGQSPQWVEKHIGETNDLGIIRKNLTSPVKAPEKAVTPSPGNDSAVHDLFYNPRREYKYRISAVHQFHTFEEAIRALAEEFEATPKWVEDHMGQENDILVIRENLKREKLNSTEGKSKNSKDY